MNSPTMEVIDVYVASFMLLPMSVSDTEVDTWFGEQLGRDDKDRPSNPNLWNTSGNLRPTICRICP